MKNVPTLVEFIEDNYALIVRPEDRDDLIEFFEANKIKITDDQRAQMHNARGVTYHDYYTGEVVMMSRGFYEQEDYTFVGAAKFMAANGYEAETEPIVPLGDSDMAVML